MADVNVNSHIGVCQIRRLFTVSHRGMQTFGITPDRRQSKTLSTITDQKSLETEFSIVICRQSGDKWQSKTLFLTIFYLRSSIVLAFSIAAYPVWECYVSSKAATMEM